MTAHHYDIIVVGMEIGPLTAGALLSKRGFRVLVVGQRGEQDLYSCLGYRFQKRPFSFPSADSPVVSRVISELSANQLFRRSLIKPPQSFQVARPGGRIDIERDFAVTKRECIRELQSTEEQMDALHERLRYLGGEIDKLLTDDLVVPPGSFFERRNLARSAVQSPFHLENRATQFTRWLEQSPAARLLAIPARFDLGDQQPQALLALARSMSSWTLGTSDFIGGRDGLRKLLSDRVIGHGGELQTDQQVGEIIVQSGRISGVRLAGNDELVSCQTILTDLTPKELSPLITPGSWTRRFEEYVASSPRSSRGYALSLGVDAELLSDWQGRTVFLVDDDRDDPLCIQRVEQEDETKAALNVACVVPPHLEDQIETGGVRDRILDRLRGFMPLLHNHLRVLHSPFDPFGPVDLTGAAQGSAPEAPSRDDLPKWLIRAPHPDDFLGIGNLPHRCGVKGLLLSGSQVVSGLGVEGEMLAAVGAARIAGKLDSRRARMVRSMRSKIEL